MPLSITYINMIADQAKGTRLTQILAGNKLYYKQNLKQEYFSWFKNVVLKFLS